MADFPGDDDWGEVDGEEEPLFADDIEDEELPPLPPPMPSLAELSQTASGSAAATLRVNPNSEENFRGRGGGGDGGAGGGDGSDEQAAEKKRKPMLTLKTERIFSDKGLPALEREFPKLKFKGKGHEAEDLNYLLQQYEHWANRLFPKLTFKDVTDRIESLATKADFKTKLIRMRRKSIMGDGMPGDEDNVDPTLQNPPEGTDNGDPHSDALGHEGGVPTRGSDGHEEAVTDAEIPNLWDASRDNGSYSEPDRLRHNHCPEDDDDLRLEEEEAFNGWDEGQHKLENHGASRLEGSQRCATERQQTVGRTSDDSGSESMETELGYNSYSHHQRNGVFPPPIDGPHQELHNSPDAEACHLVNGRDNQTEPWKVDADGNPDRWTVEAVDARRGRKRRLSSDEDSDDGALVIADSSEYNQHTSTFP